MFSLLCQQTGGGLLVLPEEPFLCTSLDDPELQRCLRTSLRKLSLAASSPLALLGVRWRTLKAILSLPQLEEFSLHGLLFSPVFAEEVTPEELEIPSLEHTKAFRYKPSPFRASGWGTVTADVHPFRTEETMLHRRVLERIHDSVERLTLSSQVAPIRAMAEWEWPCLRELTLRGERWAEPPSTPFASLFASMPRLRKVAFELTLVHGQLTAAPPLWPRGHRAAFPWPDLTHLSLSHPRVEDEVFAHLPPTLRSLSLCCCPHKSERAFLDMDSEEPHQYKYPVLDSSGMLGILHRCRTPRLEHLALEYNACEGEHDLLRYLVFAFPQLASLQVQRSRMAGTAAVRTSR